jgi:hypothetical protein
MDYHAIVRLLSSTLQVPVRFLERSPAQNSCGPHAESVLGTRATMEIIA